MYRSNVKIIDYNYFKIRTESSLSLPIGWPTIPVCLGLRSFLRHGTFSAESGEILSRPGWVSYPTCPRNGHIIVPACWWLTVVDISAVHQYFWFSSPSGHTLHFSIPLKLCMTMRLALANKRWVDLMCVTPEWKNLRPHAPFSIHCLLLAWQTLKPWSWDGCILKWCRISLWSRALGLPMLDGSCEQNLASLISCWDLHVFHHCSKTLRNLTGTTTTRNLISNLFKLKFLKQKKKKNSVGFFLRWNFKAHNQKASCVNIGNLSLVSQEA